MAFEQNKGSSSNSNSQPSAVSTVVTDLIRAAVGGNTNNVTDEDLDKYVANLILKEAEAKRKKYQNVGVSAYMPDQSSPLPKPNKRFLLNMVRATDSHNQALLEQQERARERDKQQRLRHEEDGGYERHHRHSDRYSRRRGRHGSTDDRSRRSASPDRSHTPHLRSEPPVSAGNSSKSADRRKHHHHHPRSSASPDTHTSERDNYHDTTTTTRRNNVGVTSSGTSSPSSSSKPVIVRGRGRRTEGTKSGMDKYFAEGYNPFMDIEPDLDQMVYTEYLDDDDRSEKKKKKDKKKKRSKKKKSSKKRKRDTEDSDTGSGTDGDERRSKRRHHHKKKRTRREDASNSNNSSDSGASGEDVWVEEPKPVRAWDVGKRGLH